MTAAGEAEKAAGELILSLVPGLGEVMSAGDAVKAFREADRLLKEGRWQVRLDEGNEKLHLNLERLDPVSGFVIRNPHLRFPK